MFLRGIRGATVSEENTKESILLETQILLEELIKTNAILPEDIATIFFSTTRDLNAEFPAVAARQMGLTSTPLLCLNEMNVPKSLKKCIRILLLVNTSKSQTKMKHVYLKEAVALRPDTQLTS